MQLQKVERIVCNCISPHRAGVVNVTNPSTQTDNIINFFDSVTSSSYAVFDSGYKYMFDRFNNQFRYVPLNADIAGLMARTSINNYPWFSPAGAQRGVINNAIKLAYNPTQGQRDLLYPKRINPVIFSPGSGIILFGDKTGLSYASAFDRINVRRLFLTIEDTIQRAARDQLFEFNDALTRLILLISLNHISAMLKQREVSLNSSLSATSQITLQMLLTQISLGLTFSLNLQDQSTSLVSLSLLTELELKL